MAVVCPDGGPAAPGEGSRHPAARTDCARRQGGQRPTHPAAPEPGAGTAGASAEGAQAAPGRSGRWVGEGRDALRTSPEIPKCQPGMGLAMGVPTAESLARQGIRRPRPSSSGSELGAQGCQLPYVSPLLCDAPAGTGAGHPHNPGAPGP